MPEVVIDSTTIDADTSTMIEPLNEETANNNSGIKEFEGVIVSVETHSPSFQETKNIHIYVFM